MQKVGFKRQDQMRKRKCLKDGSKLLKRSSSLDHIRLTSSDKLLIVGEEGGVEEKPQRLSDKKL